MLHFFRQSVSSIPLPESFTNPFCYTPHPLCIRAVEEVQDYLTATDSDQRFSEEGKMFGVLVVRTNEGETGFLAAFSGLLHGKSIHPYFVPPVYNLQQPDGFFRKEEEFISSLNRQISSFMQSPDYLMTRKELAAITVRAEKALSEMKKNLAEAKAKRDQKRSQPLGAEETEQLIHESQYLKAEYKRLKQYWKEKTEEIQKQTDRFDSQLEALKRERKTRSAALQQKLFEQFRFLNAWGEIKNLCDIFKSTTHQIPPAGAGECAAPRLLQYAYLHHLHPVAMAEFWWGCPPKTEIRRQGYYYPACKGKCEPILQHMLKGLKIEKKLVHEITGNQIIFPEVLYEDKWLLVLHKPVGMLSVPGKNGQLSVYDLIRKRYPEATGPLLVHRLDMATSGLMLIAKDKNTHQQLQKQFLQRTVRKKYTALLDGIVKTDRGCIRLPLCPDPNDRPRQIVHEKYGKPAITFYRVVSRTAGHTLISFYPLTGRTHQLRVHAAHPQGLNAPITGDPLYGKKAGRLYLHAGYLAFVHPVKEVRIQIEKEADF